MIDEYIEIAKSFFENQKPGFINAALDAIAGDARPHLTSSTGSRPCDP